jgi:hypothetical protein
VEELPDPFQSFSGTSQFGSRGFHPSNQGTSWKKIGRPFPRADQTDRPGVAITLPDTQFPFYNALFLTGQVTDAQVLLDRVQEAADYMRARTNRGWFVVCLDNVHGAAKESLATILDQAKFAQAIPITGMAGNILPMEASGHPALRFERIFNHSRIQEFAQSIVFPTMCRRKRAPP